MKATMRIASGEHQRPLPKRVKLTVRAIEAITPPATGRTMIHDADHRGLSLRVSADGVKVWYYHGRVAGRPTKIRLGQWPGMTVEQARQAARGILSKVDAGADPLAEKRRASGAMTLGALWEWFLENHAKPHKRSWKDDECRWTVHLKTWAARPLRSITRSDVAALHLRIGKEQPRTANRVLALLSTMFSKARIVLNLDTPNPTEGVQKFPEVERERFLSADELPRFFTALEQCSPTMRDFVAMCLWTAARASNTKAMAWADIDLTTATWTVSGEEAKAGKTLTIVLPPQAIEILRRRLDERSAGCPWVFPADDSASGHLAQYDHAWANLCKRAGLVGLRLHDLRRTAASWAAAGGANLSIIGAALGHSAIQTTKRYARVNIAPVRQAMNDAAQAIQNASGKGRKGKVKP